MYIFYKILIGEYGKIICQNWKSFEKLLFMLKNYGQGQTIGTDRY